MVMENVKKYKYFVSSIVVVVAMYFIYVSLCFSSMTLGLGTPSGTAVSLGW